MDVNIRFGTGANKAWLQSIDRHIDPEYIDFKLNHREILIAEHNDQAAGYLRLEYLWTKVPYIGLILVKEEYRGQGIGTALIQYLQTHLKQRGLTKLYSSSQVNEEEPQRWHRTKGFKETGIINGINEEGIGEVFFVKEL